MSTIDLERQVERHDVAVQELRRWQESQNGTLRRLEERLHSLERWIMCTLATAVASLVVLTIELIVR